MEIRPVGRPFAYALSNLPIAFIHSVALPFPTRRLPFSVLVNIPIADPDHDRLEVHKAPSMSPKPPGQQDSF